MKPPKFVLITLPPATPGGQSRSIRIDDLPKGRPVKIVEAVRVDDISILKAEDGRLYSAGKRNSNISVNFLNTWCETRLRALARLKVLTPAEVAVILRKQTANQKEYDRKSAVDLLATACKRLGIKVPKVPRAKTAPAPSR